MGHTEKKAAAALESLDGMQRATPSPYFYTRLRARMGREESGWNGIAVLISRPLFALCMIAVVLFVNTWIVLRSNDSDSLPANAFQVTADVPDEYNMAVNTFYDYEMSAHE